MIKLIDYKENPITHCGKVAGLCWGANTEDDEKNFILTTLKYSVFYDYNFITKCLCSNCKNPFYIFGMFTYLCFYNEEEEDSKEEEDNKKELESGLNDIIGGKTDVRTPERKEQEE